MIAYSVQMIPYSILNRISPNDSLLTALYLAGYQMIPYSISKDNCKLACCYATRISEIGLY